MVLAILCELQIPCAQIAAFKSNCMSTAKSLAQAQLTYAADNDGAWCDKSDWQAVLSPDKVLTCPGALGSVSHALNKGLVGKKTDSITDPKQVMIFDADGKAICDEQCLATKRHLGAPVCATVEGATKWFNTEGPTKLMW